MAAAARKANTSVVSTAVDVGASRRVNGGISSCRLLLRPALKQIKMSFLHAGRGGEWREQDRDSDSDGETAYLGGCSSDESDDGVKYDDQLPAQFLGVRIIRRRCSSDALSSDEEQEDYDMSSDDEEMSQQCEILSSQDEEDDEGETVPIQKRTSSPNVSVATKASAEMKADDSPPSPWGKSKSKRRIIDELMLGPEKSGIYKWIGSYTDDDWSNVNFVKIRELYASNKYKMSNFRENVKRLLKHRFNNTGDFATKKDTVEPWYTSATNVSKAYKLLWLLYMDPAKCKEISKMTGEQVWKSHPLFQRYEKADFLKWNKAMQGLTSKRRKLIDEEEEAFQRDMLLLPRMSETSRGLPFWNKHPASSLLAADVRDGTSNRMKPQKLWKSRKEYQDFPLCVFRKHIYQERRKQLSTPAWQYRRNKKAQKKVLEEARKLKEEWHQIQWEEGMGELVQRWDKLILN